METINNMATAAAQAVWGTNDNKSAEEPPSGVQGDTSKGEPFDGGNIGGTTHITSPSYLTPHF